MTLALTQVNWYAWENARRNQDKINLQMLLKEHSSVKNKDGKLISYARVQSDMSLVD